MNQENIYQYAEKELKKDADFFRIQSVSAQNKGIQEV